MGAILRHLKKTFKDMDKLLFFLMVGMIIFGLLNIVTASSREAVVRYETSLYHYFFQQLKMVTIGMVGFIFFLNLPTKRYYKFAGIAFCICFLLCFYLLLTGVELKGAKNWIRIAGFTFQPSEISKPVIIVCLALLFERFNRRLRMKSLNHISMIGIILIVGMVIPVIVFLQKDLGTMLIMVSIFAVMFWFSPVLKEEKFKTIMLGIVLCIAACFIMLITKGYILTEAQTARFNFFNPCSNYEHGGYQVCNAFIAINDGGLFGLGIGKSKQKYSYIPEPHTDSVFAIIAEEYGFLRSSIIFLVYILMLKKIFELASNANTMRGRYICIGAGVYLFSHIMINLGGLFGVIPLTGVPLPFLSYGGSYIISLMSTFGVIQRIAIETKNQKIRIY
ncbi:MAG TPA: FtsW/RodA/SpoVE family cell cycle protein [Tenericutes bacterium]|nr:FtsW/RodA/SpoVE family cell cycle protein [Mycoplasmatota bacterium]